MYLFKFFTAMVTVLRYCVFLSAALVVTVGIYFTFLKIRII